MPTPPRLAEDALTSALESARVLVAELAPVLGSETRRGRYSHQEGARACDIKHTGGARPDTTLAETEIAEAVGGAGESRGGTLLGSSDAFDRRGESYPELSAEAQAQLVGAYQHSLQVRAEWAGEEGVARGAAAEERALGQYGEWALTYLLGAVSRLLRQIAHEHAERRRSGGEDLASEYMSELLLLATEAARTFEAARGPSFAQYVSLRARQHLASIAAESLPGKMDPAWERVHRLALGAGPELADELGRAPSLDELRERLRERAWAWAYERLTPAQLGESAPAQKRLAEAKLAKQGTLKAIDDLHLILARAQHPFELDAPLAESEEESQGVLLADPSAGVEAEVGRRETRSELTALLEVGFGGCSEAERDTVLARLGEIDGEEWGFSRILSEYAHTTAETRALVRSVRTRLRAGHAQYAYLCEGIEAQFETIPLEESAVENFRRLRRARRLTLAG